MRKKLVVAVLCVLGVVLLAGYIFLSRAFQERVRENEGIALEAMNSIFTAQESFRKAGHVDADGDSEGDYGSLAQLGDPDGDGKVKPFIDAVLSSGLKGGYNYNISVTHGDSAENIEPAFSVSAEPFHGKGRNYFVDETGVVRSTMKNQ